MSSKSVSVHVFLALQSVESWKTEVVRRSIDPIDTDLTPTPTRPRYYYYFDNITLDSDEALQRPSDDTPDKQNAAEGEDEIEDRLSSPRSGDIAD